MCQPETNLIPLTILGVPSYEIKQHQKVQMKNKFVSRK